jgi:hypothetical protein
MCTPERILLLADRLVRTSEYITCRACTHLARAAGGARLGSIMVISSRAASFRGCLTARIPNRQF